jgi:ubiquinone/menaquinone biosynthesis C-methylase UbiE
VGYYSSRILPALIDKAMRNRELLPYRQRVLAPAAGSVLEIGMGAGANVPLYGASVTQIVGLEPLARLAGKARESGIRCQRAVEVVAAGAEEMPFPDQHFDTVVTTWTLCSIAEPSRALAEVRRVLKPTGQLLFVEHGQSPDADVHRWQNRLTPCWKHIAGGCHLNRPIRTLIEGAGFIVERLATGYMKGPRPMTYMYEGRAVRAST